MLNHFVLLGFDGKVDISLPAIANKPNFMDFFLFDQSMRRINKLKILRDQSRCFSDEIKVAFQVTKTKHLKHLSLCILLLQAFVVSACFLKRVLHDLDLKISQGAMLHGCARCHLSNGDSPLMA